MARSTLDLGGKWQFSFGEDGNFRTAAELAAAGRKLIPATVPGNFELDLQTNGIVPEPFIGLNMMELYKYEQSHVWYGRTFDCHPQADMDALLVFEGLDCLADVWINGNPLGSTDNMLVEHEFDVNGLVREGTNELLVHFRPSAGTERKWGEFKHIRKAAHTFGWDIMPRAVSAGIWRPVSLRFVPKVRIEDAWIETLDLGETVRSRLHYRIRLEEGTGQAKRPLFLELVGRCDDFTFSASGAIDPSGMLDFEIECPQLWWPRDRGKQDLYGTMLTLKGSGEHFDTNFSSHGIRTVELISTEVTDEEGNGEFCFRVNGEKLFVRGSNWVPADAYHSRDAERIPRMLDLAENIGCNMLRCWGGNVYENDLFYDICDLKGILIWQDFSMACTQYPQDDEFAAELEDEARKVVRRLRRHPSVALWSGDNECDQCWRFWGGGGKDPNGNRLTREVLPRVLREEDPSRPYLPSSPYIGPAAVETGEALLPEQHLWGTRPYFKDDYFAKSICHFASEIGYHGCPSPDSMREFLSPARLWPWKDNPEWLLHSSEPDPEHLQFGNRIELMVRHLEFLFGTAPDNLDDFAFASQAAQGEAYKFFVELFRLAKWRKTGIIWWNLIDGWPQFSDAVVDYYFREKLAYHFIKRSQQPLCLMLSEPVAGVQRVVACNDTPDDLTVHYSVRDVAGGVVAERTGNAKGDANTTLCEIAHAEPHMYVIEWTSPVGEGANHYLSATPPVDMAWYCDQLLHSELYPIPQD